MQEFYKKALLALILLLIADALAAGFCIVQSYPSATLIPQARGGMHSRVVTTTDAEQGGTSAIRILESGRQSLRFDFRVTSVAVYPFVSAQLLLEDGRGNAVPADLSKYTTVTFVAKCAPANALLFTMPTFDAGISKPGEFLTYPSPETYFSCSEQGTPVSLDLTRLAIPPWWFEQLKTDPLRQSYTLEHVAKFVFGASPQSPRERDSHVEISDFTLHGRDERYIVALALILAAGGSAFVLWFFRAHAQALVASVESHRGNDLPLVAYRQLTHGRDDRYLAALAAVLVISWSAFGIWFFRARSRALIAKLDSRLKKDLPFVAYRQLTLEPYQDKEKATVLRFIATNYTNPELDLGAVAAGTGANRNKINEVLKTELGMTFSSYLNKLRLMEAARLLTDKASATVAEIAHSVGYAHGSYFIKLFKEEYGCTPKAFRNLSTRPQTRSGRTQKGPSNQPLDKRT